MYRCAQIVLRPVCRYLLFPFDSRVVNVLKLDSVIFLGLIIYLLCHVTQFSVGF